MRLHIPRTLPDCIALIIDLQNKHHEPQERINKIEDREAKKQQILSEVIQEYKDSLTK